MVGDEQARQVVDVATRMFAELGFDGTSLQLIAEAAGMPLDTVIAVAGDKVQLYLEVMRHVSQVEMSVMGEALAAFTPTREGVLALADVYLDFCAGHPQIVLLWLHRWMGDAADVTGLEEVYSRELTAGITSAIRDVLPPDVDADHFAWSIVWMVYGFLSGRMQHTAPDAPARPSRRHGVGGDLVGLSDFRRYVHTYIRRMTAP